MIIQVNSNYITEVLVGSNKDKEELRELALEQIKGHVVEAHIVKTIILSNQVINFITRDKLLKHHSSKRKRSYK